VRYECALHGEREGWGREEKCKPVKALVEETEHTRRSSWRKKNEQGKFFLKALLKRRLEKKKPGGIGLF